MLHIFPQNDWIEHNTDNETSCACDPDVFYIYPESGLPLEEPLVIHKSLSGDHPMVEFCGEIYG